MSRGRCQPGCGASHLLPTPQPRHVRPALENRRHHNHRDYLTSIHCSVPADELAARRVCPPSPPPDSCRLNLRFAIPKQSIPESETPSNPKFLFKELDKKAAQDLAAKHPWLKPLFVDGRGMLNMKVHICRNRN